MPVVYEAAPMALFRAHPAQAPRRCACGGAGARNPVSPRNRVFPQTCRRRPDIGFWGRDETLLALDRAFDGQHVALVHAYAGSGKTMTAAEFARGTRPPAGCERRGALLLVRAAVHRWRARWTRSAEHAFHPLLQANGIHWLALTTRSAASRASSRPADCRSCGFGTTWSRWQASPRARPPLERRGAGRTGGFPAWAGTRGRASC